jgi:tRNA-dihydrouridine synthase B
MRKNFAGAADLRGQLSVVDKVQHGLDLIDRAIEQLANGYEVIEENELAIAQ